MDVSGDVEIKMGGQTCTVCTHESKEAVDQAIVAGESNRVIASQYGLDKSAVGRHRQNHLPATLVKAAEAKDEAHSQALLDQVRGLLTKTTDILDEAIQEKDKRVALMAVRESRGVIELAGRFTGELRDNNRDGTPDTALDAILKLASVLSDAELRRMAGLTPAGQTIEGESHVVDEQ